MNKDLIETPRFNFFIGDEVLLKGKIVGFDVDENKCVENVVRLEYGQTLNVPNNNIYITDDIVDKSKIKVVVPQFVADWYEENKDSFEFNVWDWIAFRDEAKKSENREFNNWINNSRENPKLYLSRTIYWLKSLSIALGYNFEECFELAYQEIKYRKGRWIDGTFVKEEDLA